MMQIKEGAYLYTQAEALEEQKTWDDLDEIKNHDFSTSKLWLITDSRIVASIEECVEFFLDDYCRDAFMQHVTKLLLDEGMIDFDMPNKDGNTALMYAATGF